MGFFDSFKKTKKPYKSESANLIYELLFCDNIQLNKQNYQSPVVYPWDILFSDTSNIADLQGITANNALESRVKMLAYTKLAGMGQKINEKILLAVIVEVGLDEGLDTLASFSDGTARYINHTGKIVIWEASDEQSNVLTNELFQHSKVIVDTLNTGNHPRKPHPAKGDLRITCIVSDGSCSGEGPMDDLFTHPLSGPALQSATALMQYLIEKSLQAEASRKPN